MELQGMGGKIAFPLTSDSQAEILTFCDTYAPCIAARFVMLCDSSVCLSVSHTHGLFRNGLIITKVNILNLIQFVMFRDTHWRSQDFQLGGAESSFFFPSPM